MPDPINTARNSRLHTPVRGTGNDAASFAKQAVSQAGDTTPPVLDSATVNGKLLVLIYTDAGNLDVVNTAAASAFVLSSAGNAAIRVNRVFVSDNAVFLTLSRKVAGGETVTLSYTRPTTGDGVIQDAAGNDAASFTDQAVRNYQGGDTTAPVLYSATVRGKQLVLTYTDVTALDAVRTAAASAFAVSSAGTAAINVDRVVVSGKTVTLMLSRAVAGGETVTLSYTRPPTGDNVIQDAAGNDAASFTNQAVSNYRAGDTTAPVLCSAMVRGKQLVLTYTDATELDAVNTAAASAFAVSSAGTAAINVDRVVVSGKTVTLMLSRAVADGETVTLSYTRPPIGDNVIQDAAGNDAASFTNQAVSNYRGGDTTAPVLYSATVRGKQLVLTYTDATDLDAVDTAAASAFAVSSAGTAAINVDRVVVSGKTVTLMLSRAVAGGETVTLSYTRPTTGDGVIQDAAGNDAASFTNQAVSNYRGGDTTAPVLYSATVRGKQLVLTYTDATDLDAVRTAAASAFAVSSAGTAAISVDRVVVSGKTVTLTLSRAVVGGEMVKLSYTRPTTGDNVIQDAAGNDAASFTDRAVSNLVPDTMAPVLYSATVRGKQLVLTYTDATDLDAVRTAAASAFAVSSAGTAAINVDRVVVSGKTVTLMLSRAVAGGEMLKLSYIRPTTGENVIQDAAGNDAASFTNRAVSNLVPDTMAPVLYSATVRGKQLVLTYTDATDLDAVRTAAASAFAVSSAGTAAINVDRVVVSGKTVTLMLSRAVAGGEMLKLSYTKPTTGDNVIQDATGNDAASFTDRAVSNYRGGDTTAPVLYSATVRGKQLVLTYTDATDLDAVNTAAASAFAVSSAGNAAIRVDRVLVSGKTVTLLLSRKVVSGEAVTLSYTRPATGDMVIQDAAGNDAASFTNQAVSNNRAGDTMAPVFYSATVRGKQLVLTYTDATDLDAVRTAAASAFAVSSAGNAAISVDRVVVSGKTVTLTLSRAVVGGETVKLSYTRPPTGDNVIQDAAGNDAASFTDRAVSNLVPDTTAPVLDSATVHGKQLVLTYTDATDLDAVRTAAASAFAVSSAGNAAISVSSVAVSGKTVTLTLSRAVAGGETLKLSYTKPTTGDNVIQDATGNDAASFTDRAVSNLARDTTAPVLGSATVNGRQ
ncbi:hypothetical protein D5039_14770 [Verminephrobacter aporrectodeae subsp. tuberculatae]|uniref:Uncharacterized protein n=2 Tax=Verminephrobacter TaxID=364316 RepID=A0ABT3KWS8_9BURK|nr:SwmB domain-containing protein [Verminephrobacter aporrectodeae]MCW5322369.1 hypothetical protein [Verminephrobacter aporrectodeae subsp. tuberculatae]